MIILGEKPEWCVFHFVFALGHYFRLYYVNLCLIGTNCGAVSGSMTSRKLIELVHCALLSNHRRKADVR